MGISVVMSVHNSEKGKYLDSCLQSIWTDQILRPSQIILVEDGPLTDELYDTIEKWSHEVGDKLTILKNSKNLGLTKSLNRAITCVSQNYIARMDSDDISTPERFYIQSKYLDEHPDIAIVGGALQEFDDEHECLNVRHYPLSSEEVRHYIHKASPLAHPSVMMRRKMFDEGLKYDERYRTSQDIALWYDALCAGYEIANVSEIAIKFRRADDVFKRRGREKAFNEFKIYMRGIRRLHGLFTLKYIYPISRLLFRLMPFKVIKFIYGSPLRAKVVSVK